MMLKAHAQARERGDDEDDEDDVEDGKERKDDQEPEFAFEDEAVVVVVNSVVKDGPAEEAGLKEGDDVVLFGDVDGNVARDDRLRRIGQLVQRMEGKGVEVVVRRDGEIVRLELVPKQWSGRGLLGAFVVLPK
eukprot:TRINITY_DN1063_c0_g1_i2.p3 TRINITY_DN1063_c0_g1~~TRINITY_DN1063_c0_g1_i2.p3  ORF type:complete len:133 (-),score=54.18 TRINITY_DN1063_c0_g1_i2:113-511(-)